MKEKIEFQLYLIEYWLQKMVFYFFYFFKFSMLNI